MHLKAAFILLLSLLALTAHGSAATDVKAAWVVLGADNQATARVVTSATQCPNLRLDGLTRRMHLRAGAETIAQRPTTSLDNLSKPAEFPITTCEYRLPGGVRHASVGLHQLPIPKAQPRRIVIIGDTGCRMKKSENLWQDCTSADSWPFAQNASNAAKMKPDLVLHVGDYQYRENPCPPDLSTCQDSPWGYGWDVWSAELFNPGAPLLAAAPWIMVRGNHEECARGGQGWFRFLDAEPYRAVRSCNDAAYDAEANFSDPYAIALGKAVQIIVFDSAKAGNSPLDLDKPSDAATFKKYQVQFEAVGKLATKTGTWSMFSNHHPILGLTPKTPTEIIGGNRTLLAVMQALNATAYYPAGIQIALHGHTHLFEAISFASDHPATVLSGNGGDTVDRALPDPLPAESAPAKGVTVDRIAHSDSFGFLVMDRQHKGWQFNAYRHDGTLMTSCHLNQRKLDCTHEGLVR